MRQVDELATLLWAQEEYPEMDLVVANRSYRYNQASMSSRLLRLSVAVLVAGSKGGGFSSRLLRLSILNRYKQASLLGALRACY